MRTILLWATLCSATLYSTVAVAQDGRRALDVATIAYASASAADHLSTAYALQAPFAVTTASGQENTFHPFERNPMYSWGPRPAMYALGAGVDIGTILIARRIGRRAPMLATAGLLIGSAIRLGAAADNLSRGRRLNEVKRVAVTWRVL